MKTIDQLLSELNKLETIIVSYIIMLTNNAHNGYNTKKFNISILNNLAATLLNIRNDILANYPKNCLLLLEYFKCKNIYYELYNKSYLKLLNPGIYENILPYEPKEDTKASHSESSSSVKNDATINTTTASQKEVTTPSVTPTAPTPTTTTTTTTTSIPTTTTKKTTSRKPDNTKIKKVISNFPTQQAQGINGIGNSSLTTPKKEATIINFANISIKIEELTSSKLNTSFSEYTYMLTGNVPHNPYTKYRITIEDASNPNCIYTSVNVVYGFIDIDKINENSTNPTLRSDSIQYRMDLFDKLLSPEHIRNCTKNSMSYIGELRKNQFGAYELHTAKNQKKESEIFSQLGVTLNYEKDGKEYFMQIIPRGVIEHRTKKDSSPDRKLAEYLVLLTDKPFTNFEEFYSTCHSKLIYGDLNLGRFSDLCDEELNSTDTITNSLKYAVYVTNLLHNSQNFENIGHPREISTGTGVYSLFHTDDFNPYFEKLCPKHLDLKIKKQQKNKN